MSDAPELLTREATADDEGFVFCTWMASHVNRCSSKHRRAMSEEYRNSYVRPILREHPRVVVLCSPGSPRTLHGHAVALRRTLAWVYVARDLRELGYARQLIAAILDGEYPERVSVHSRWPFPSQRFEFIKYDNVTAA